MLFLFLVLSIFIYYQNIIIITDCHILFQLNPLVIFFNIGVMVVEAISVVHIVIYCSSSEIAVLCHADPIDGNPLLSFKWLLLLFE